MLTACGGGGGGDGTVAPGGAGGATGPLTYRGSSSPAIITTTNASQLSANVLGAQGSLSAVSSLASSSQQGSGEGAIARRVNRVVRQSAALSSTARQFRSAVEVDEFQPCRNGGSVRYVGSLNDNNTGTLSVFYAGCRNGEDTLDGAATMRVDAYVIGIGVTDYLLTFDRLSLLGSRGLREDLSGSVRSRVDVPTRADTYTENVVVLKPSGRMTKSENLTFIDVYNDLSDPAYYTESVAGRVYDSVHGYVEVTTGVPLLFGTMTQPFPDSGQITLAGAGNGRIRITAFSATTLTLALDLNGDNAYEIVAHLHWDWFGELVSADLGDSDGDGLHNSFESVMRLNPMDPADAAQDLDGDGATNLAEYRAFTNVGGNSSYPPASALAMTANDFPDPVALGDNITWDLFLTNTSHVAAENVVVTDTLPAGVNLVSVFTGQGSCTTSGPIVCSLGTVSGSAGLRIVVSPTATGVYTNTARLTTSTFDPVTNDNVVVMTTTVGQPLHGIQGLIDAAAPGETVAVGPGIYYGGLNFRGKNIVLRSSAGPAGTILHGNNTTAVSMGPGGTISGFTITGGFGYSGAAIEVSGQGSVISGNIFDGNVQAIGGYGVGIGGNGASPIIERNVFRNNSCDNQFTSGVVSFVNTSSPVIVNNVFENNQCRGINMVLPEGSAPLVMNNTFVGNRAAIRVDRRVPTGTQIFRNNLIFQNGIGLEVDFTGEVNNPVWTNNLVFGNTTNYRGITNQTGINGNISVDPSFMNPSAGNYPLQPKSPAIDAGAAAGAPAVDFSGSPRPRDGNGDGTAIVDIGAFEAP